MTVNDIIKELQRIPSRDRERPIPDISDMDYYEKLRKATEDSEPSTLFDDLSMMDKLLNSLVVKIANAIRGFRKKIGR